MPPWEDFNCSVEVIESDTKVWAEKNLIERWLNTGLFMRNVWWESIKCCPNISEMILSANMFESMLVWANVALQARVPAKSFINWVGRFSHCLLPMPEGLQMLQ